MLFLALGHGEHRCGREILVKIHPVQEKLPAGHGTQRKIISAVFHFQSLGDVEPAVGTSVIIADRSKAAALVIVQPVRITALVKSGCPQDVFYAETGDKIPSGPEPQGKGVVRIAFLSSI